MELPKALICVRRDFLQSLHESEARTCILRLFEKKGWSTIRCECGRSCVETYTSGYCVEQVAARCSDMRGRHRRSKVQPVGGVESLYPLHCAIHCSGSQHLSIVASETDGPSDVSTTSVGQFVVGCRTRDISEIDAISIKGTRPRRMLGVCHHRVDGDRQFGRARENVHLNRTQLNVAIPRALAKCRRADRNAPQTAPPRPHPQLKCNCTCSS